MNLLLTVISIVLSTLAFIFGSKVIEDTQKPVPIYITYPEGYTDLPENPPNPKVLKTKKPKLAKP